MKWKNYSEDENSKEPAEDIMKHSCDLVLEFWAEQDLKRKHEKAKKRKRKRIEISSSEEEDDDSEKLRFLFKRSS